MCPSNSCGKERIFIVKCLKVGDGIQAWKGGMVMKYVGAKDDDCYCVKSMEGSVDND
jgi:hypothetical protein